MSERPPTQLLLATRHLSADGKRVLPDENEVRPKPVSEAMALATLQAFASLRAVDLVDADAKIYLEGPRAKVAVQNVRGKLFATRVPESVNTALERTAEQIVELVTVGDPTVVAAVAAEAAAVEEAAQVEEAAEELVETKSKLGSVWKLVLVVGVAAVIGYLNFRPPTPDGVQWISDSAKIAKLTTEYAGRYGKPGGIVLVVANGKITGKQTSPTGASETQLFEMHFRFGYHNADVVLVADNGVLFEPQADQSLRYLENVYPKLAK